MRTWVRCERKCETRRMKMRGLRARETREEQEIFLKYET